MSERLHTLVQQGSTPNAFATYQHYQQDLHQGEFDAAKLKLSQMKSTMSTLGLNLWQDWLDHPRT